MIFHDQLGQEYDFDLAKIKLEWRISVYGVVINEQNQTLMMVPHYSDKRQFSGGMVEHGEMLGEALAREFLEELGFKINTNNKELIYCRENYFYNSYKKQHFHSIQLTFKVELADSKHYPELIDRGEGLDFGDYEWVDYTQLTEDQVQHTHWAIVQKLQNLI